MSACLRRRATRSIVLLQRTDTEGGTRRIMHGLHGRLRERGVRARLVFIREHEDAVRARRSWPLAAAQSARDVVALVRTLLRERPSVLVTFTPLMGAIASVVGKVLWDATCIATHHTPAGRLGPVARWLDGLAGTSGAYDEIIACSPAVMTSLRRRGRRYRDKLTMIPNGVPTVPRRRRRDAAARARGSLGIGAQDCVAFSAGSLTADKNHVVVVRALERLPRWHLVIAGEGEMRDSLLASAEAVGVDRRVHLLGAVAHDVVSTWMDACQAYVQPSKVEGLSLALLEAMAHGAPCIAADIAENRAPLEDGDQVAGHLLPPDDAVRWEQALEWIQRHPVEADAMGARARAVQRRRFDQERMYAAYMTVIMRAYGA